MAMVVVRYGILAISYPPPSAHGYVVNSIKFDPWRVISLFRLQHPRIGRILDQSPITLLASKRLDDHIVGFSFLPVSLCSQATRQDQNHCRLISFEPHEGHFVGNRLSVLPVPSSWLFINDGNLTKCREGLRSNLPSPSPTAHAQVIYITKFDLRR